MSSPEGNLRQAVMADREVTEAHQKEIFLEVLQSKIQDQEQSEATQNLMDMAVRAGRIQTAKVLGKMADVIHVSQIRELKDLSREAGIPWIKASEMFGFSSKTADQYLRLGSELGDDFVADMSAIGVSVRALEAARKLPEEVREKLTTGEVIDLEEVSKDQLTTVIKDLARDHTQELSAKEEALGKESKAKQKAERKAQELGEHLRALQEELDHLRAGLPADDAEALETIQGIEKKVIPLLMVLRHTKMQERSPEAKARIITSLELVRAVAEWTSNHLAALAEGDQPDDEVLGMEARRLGDEIAASDGAAPPGL